MNFRRCCSAITVRATVALAFALAGCAQRDVASPIHPLHLVIDAGSTGTRFCVFAVERDASGACHAPHSGAAESAAAGACRSVPAPNGLADLGPAEAARVVESGLAQFSPDTARRITGATLLGTGGFRRQPEAAQQAILDALRTRFGARGEASIRRIEVLSGSMEGVLAWRAMQELGATPPFAIVEIGGATVQYATSEAATSAPIGLTAVTNALAASGRGAECRVDDSRGAGFAACRAAVAATPVKDAASLAPRSGAAAPITLYGLGAPWSATFAMARTERLAATEIDALGERVCRLDANAARGVTGDHWSPRLACMLLAYQSVLLEALDAREVRRGGESWPRGAAVSAEFFPDCAASTVRR